MGRFLTKFFKDSRGSIVLWQWPNVWIYGWAFFGVLARLFSSGIVATGSRVVSTLALIVWAFFEITEGVNYFRRLLGAIVLGVIAFHIFA
jgi:hypothetical protein